MLRLRSDVHLAKRWCTARSAARAPKLPNGNHGTVAGLHSQDLNPGIGQNIDSRDLAL